MDVNDCGSCFAATPVQRREFLRDAAAAVTLALVAVGARTADAFALPVSVIRGRQAGADKQYPFPESDGVFIDKDEDVIVARSAGKVFAFSLACPHQNTAIRWDAGNARFQCPKHKSRHRPDGTFIEGRATRGLDRFAVRRDADNLLVNLDALYREDKESALWTLAFVAV